jgi:hypothetical protein
LRQELISAPLDAAQSDAVIAQLDRQLHRSLLHVTAPLRGRIAVSRGTLRLDVPRVFSVRP